MKVPVVAARGTQYRNQLIIRSPLRDYGGRRPIHGQFRRKSFPDGSCWPAGVTFVSSMVRRRKPGRTSMPRIAIVGAIVLGLAPGIAWSQANPQFIAFGGINKGALYRPDSGPAPHVGLLAMHH